MMRYLLFTFYIFSATLLGAQSMRYWGTQFNSESSLLGDAVVGDNSGITSIYFNPAGIMEADNNQLSLSANLINLSYETYNNALGKDANLVDWGFRVQPRFATFIYRPDSSRFAYQFAILNRKNKDIFTYNEVAFEKDFLYNNHSEEYHGTFSITSEYSDYWGGAGLAYKVNKRIIVGASAFFSVKNYLYTYHLKALVFPQMRKLHDSTDFYSAVWDAGANQTSYDVRALAKAGIRYKYGNFHIGLNFTLPSFHIYGNSDVQKNLIQSGINKIDSTAPDYTFFESGKYRKVNFKDPFSAAIGLAYHMPDKKAVLYFTAEYFASLKRYKMIDGTKVVSSEKDNYQPGSDFLSFYYQTKQIVNFAIGYQYKFSDKVEILSGFKTDFDAAVRMTPGNVFEEATTFKEVQANIYHYNIGGKLNILKSSFTVGFQFSYGQAKNIPQYANFTDPVLYNPDTGMGLQGTRSNTMIYKYFDIGFYLGFLFGF